MLELSVRSKRRHLLGTLLVVILCGLTHPTLIRGVSSYECLDMEREGEAPRPAEEMLSFCRHYSSCTCCGPSDADAAMKKMRGLESLSRECRSTLGRLVCQSCDPDVGVGLRKGVCDSFCTEMYDSCEDDYWEMRDGFENEEDEENGYSLWPCLGDGHHCHPLRTIVKGPRDLCGHLNLSVERRKCFDGVLRSSKTCMVHGEDWRGEQEPKSSFTLILVCAYMMIFSVTIAFILFCGPESRAAFKSFLGYRGSDADAYGETNYYHDD